MPAAAAAPAAAARTTTGLDAIQALTALEHAEGVFRIVEHDTGIDVDNAGRPYDNVTPSSYRNAMWTALVYLSEAHANLDAWFTAQAIPTPTAWNPNAERLLSFAIHTREHDSEADAITYQVEWLQTIDTHGFDVRRGDTLPRQGGRIVTGWEMVPSGRKTGTDLDFDLALLDASGNVITRVGYGDPIRVTRYA